MVDKIPITQTKQWEKLQTDLGEESYFVRQDRYQYLAIQKKTPVGNYLYLPYGPVFEGEKGKQEVLSSIDELAKHIKPIFIRIEPQDPVLIENCPPFFKKVKDVSPKDTWVLDLSPDEETIVSNFKHSLRATYRNYAKKGLSVEVTRDPEEINHLVKLQDKLYQKKHLNAFSKHYLETELKQPFASLYLVKYHHPENQEENSENEIIPKEDQVLAASLFFDDENTRYYMQSAADEDYRRLRATAALLIKAIFDAKEKGIKEFDFWGIAPEGAPKDHPWAGFTEFKKSFGGEARHYAGTYDIVLNKPKYALYKKLRQIKNHK